MKSRLSFPCSKCGSRNTELSDHPPYKNLDFVDRIKKFLLSLSPIGYNRFPMGRKFIICKDCGYVSCIQIL